MRKFAVGLMLMIGAGVLGFFAYQHSPLGDGGVEGKTAPDIQFHTIEGKTVALTDYRGQWVLLNFWAPWCAPCMDEIPLLVQAQKQYSADGLRLIGPALDDVDSVRAAVKKLGINYPVTADFSGADTAMQVLGNGKGGLPYSVLIDPQGQVVQTVLGGFTPQALNKMLQSRLAH